MDDDTVDIEMDGNKLLRQQEPDSDAEQDELLPRKKGVRFGQRDLVAEAFAGDNVVEVSSPSPACIKLTGRNSQRRRLASSRPMPPRRRTRPCPAGCVKFNTSWTTS